METVLYVSDRTTPGDMIEIDDILSVSRARNVQMDVTGALVATPNHYAQLLEGSREALAELMASIEADPRHTGLRLADLPHKSYRDLPRWSLAYVGDSAYVSDLMAAVVATPDARSFEAIRALMLMFA